MSFIARWFIAALALLLAAYLVPGIHVTGFIAAFFSAVILGFLNAAIRPVLVLLTFPAVIISFGLFTLVINAFLLWLVALVVPGFSVDGFVAVFFGALIISAVSWIVNRL